VRRAAAECPAKTFATLEDHTCDRTAQTGGKALLSSSQPERLLWEDPRGILASVRAFLYARCLHHLVYSPAGPALMNLPRLTAKLTITPRCRNISA